MENYFDIVRQVLIPMFYKETQLGRSLRSTNPSFKKQLFDSITELSNKADNGTLTNEDIRKKIVDISKGTKVSVGKAQKVINVYLKYYCILTKKTDNIIKELDCPLDSQIMSEFKTRNLRKVPLKHFDNINDYIAWQDHLEKIGEGIRLRLDIQTYDRKRMQLFFSS